MIHMRNIQSFANEMFGVSRNILPTPFMNNIFKENSNSWYNLKA